MPRTDEHGIAWYTRADVAEHRGVSLDAVKRDHRERDPYPNARPRPDDPQRAIEIPESDLHAAGHLTGDHRDGTAEQVVTDQVEQREALQREVAELRHEVTRVREREALLTEQLQRDRERSPGSD